MVRQGITAALVAVGLAWSGSAQAGGLKLHPDGFGQKSYAAWKSQQGEADDQGNANQALYFQKMVPTATFAAGVAVFEGVENLDVTNGLVLGFDHRLDGHCGAGAPRFNITIQNPDGSRQTLFVGCAGMAPRPASEPGWEGHVATLPIPAGATVVGLAIVFDEGTDEGQGFVFLDNIQVNDKIWTCAADDANS